MGSEFISNSIGSWLMLYSNWTPLLLGWGIIIFGVCLGITLPETKNAFQSGEQKHQNQTEEHELSSLHDDENEHPAFDKPVHAETPKTKWQRAVSAVKAYSFLLKNKQVMLLFSAFLVFKLSRGSSWFLVQYVSLRYGWKLVAANLLVSLKSILMVGLLLVVLPLASWYLEKKRGVDSRTKDLMITKASVICLLIGTLGMGVSPYVWLVIFFLVIQTMGAGFVYTTRAIVATMIKPEETARVYVMIEIIQAFGMILASPTMTSVFKLGIDLGGFWRGLAWIFASSLFTIVAGIIWRVKIPPTPATHDD